jgi:hypothetical protein
MKLKAPATLHRVPEASLKHDRMPCSCAADARLCYRICHCIKLAFFLLLYSLHTLEKIGSSDHVKKAALEPYFRRPKHWHLERLLASYSCMTLWSLSCLPTVWFTSCLRSALILTLQVVKGPVQLRRASVQVECHRVDDLS